MRKILAMMFLTAAGLPLACSSTGDNNGVPLCADGYINCGGMCTDITGDGKNCSAGGMACAAEQVCSAGACQDSCTEPGRTRCDSSCVDMVSNPSHCGGCRLACTGADQVCQGGLCSDSSAGTGGSDSGTGGAGTGGGGTTYSTELLIEEGDIGQCEADGVVESTNAGFSGTGY